MTGVKNSFISGVWYTGLSKYLGVFISIAVTAVLARALTPHEFGIVAIATVFIMIFSVVITEGFSPAIIQNKRLTDVDLKSINSFTYLVAIALTGFYLLSVPLIANYYESEVLGKVLRIYALSVFFSVINIVPNALLMKAKRFKFIAKRSLCVQFVLGAVSIWTVYQGVGIYALLINPVGSSVLVFMISYAANPIGWGSVKKASVAKIFSYSVFQMLYTALHIGYRNIDKLLIGKYMGAANLGYYEKSYRLMMLPLENVSSVILPVLHPLLSEYQSNKDYLWDAYKKMIAFMSEFCFVVSVGLFFLARFIILLLFGDQWESAVPIFQVLSLSVSFQLMQSPMGAIFLSANAVRQLMLSTLWIFLLMTGGIVFAITLGYFWLVPVVVVFVFLLGFVIYQSSMARLFEKRSGEVYRLMLPHIAYAGILFLMLYGVSSMIGDSFWWQGIMVIFLVLLYLVILFFTNRIPQMRQFVIGLLRRRDK